MNTKFQIKFAAGSLAPQFFAIQPGTVLALGRSRSNTIVLTEPDVSARHCILRLDSQDEKGVWIEVISSRKTMLDGKALQIGDKVLITEGQTVSLGENVAFVLIKADNSVTDNNDDLPTGQIQNGDDIQTQAVQTGDDIQTQAIQTGDDIQTQAVQTGDEQKTVAQTVVQPEQAQKTQTAVPKIEDSPMAASSNDVASDDSEFETVAVQTRMASTEEIDFIRRGYQKKRLIRFWLIVIPIMIFAIVSFTLYFQPKKDPVLNWPDTNDPEAQYGMLLTSYLKVVFPGTRHLSYDKKELFWEAHSAFGDNHEIPLNVYAQRWISTDSLIETREQTFQNECIARLEKKLNTDLNLEAGHAPSRVWTALDYVKKDENGNIQFFNKNSAGIPIIYTAYSRDTKNSGSMSGFLIFFRSEALCGYCMFEIPSAFFDKNRELFRPLLWSMFILSSPKNNPNYAATYWEGSPDYDKKTPIPQLMKLIADWEKDNSKAPWWNRYYAIRSVLIRLRSQGITQGDFVKAKAHLAQLRKEQSQAYARWACIMKGSANQAEKERVKRDSKQAFSPEFEQVDHRYGKIRREEW